MSTIRVKKVSDFIERLRTRMRVLEDQLTKNYADENDPYQLLVKGEIKALSEVVAEMEEHFKS